MASVGLAMFGLKGILGVSHFVVMAASGWPCLRRNILVKVHDEG